MKNRIIIVYAFFVVLTILVITQLQGLTDKYSISPDTRSMFTVHHFPEGLKDDIIVQYFSTKTGSKIPLINFYAFINRFTDFVLVTKIISILLFLISIYYTYRLGRKIGDRRYALILMMIFSIFAWGVFPLSGGTSRSFSIPLIIAFLYYLINKEVWKLSLVTILLAVFYPPVWLVSIGIYGLSMINFKERKIHAHWKTQGIFYVSLVISVAAILFSMFFFDYGFNDPVTFQEALHLPEFYLGGRIPLFKAAEPVISSPLDIVKTIAYLYNFGIKTPIFTNSVFMLSIITIIFSIKYMRKISLPKEIYFLVFASIFFQILSSLVMFNLYFPNRYVIITIPLFFTIILAQGIYHWTSQHKNTWQIGIVMLLLIVINVPMLDKQFSHCPDQEVYEFLKNQQQDDVFASHPDDADCIATYSKMKPFLTTETAIPFDKKYYTIIKERTYDFFSAYYSTNQSELRKFCEENEVTYIVVDQKYFGVQYLNKTMMYFDPFNDHIRNITKKIRSRYSSFYLENPSGVLFVNNGKKVVKCREDNFSKDGASPFKNQWPSYD